MRKTAFCPMCETTIYADDVHSCYDAAAVRHARAMQDAREAVVKAAVDYEKWMGKWHDYSVKCGDKPAKQQRALIDAVRHLATLATAQGHNDDADWNYTTPTKARDDR